MSAWTVLSLCATLVLAVSGIVIARGTIGARIAALPFATGVACVDFLATAQSFGNSSAFDVALALALLSFPASLVYARFYARWL